MTSRRPAMFLAAAVLASGLLLSGAPAGASDQPTVDAGPALGTSAAHPYSDPHWFPLHTPAKISCVKSNCTSKGSDYHGYWAMDLLDPENTPGDPVYAAGAGVFHIGSNQQTCGAAGTVERRGAWAWIDHGGGVVSRYHHLATIVAKDGELVTPATVIATMGRGSVSPCTTTYLHFEVRHGGILGSRVNPGTLWVCSHGRRASWPQSLPGGVKSWDDLAPRTFVTPATTSDCVTDTWRTTAAAPTRLTGARGNGWIRVGWPAPGQGVTRVVVALETYHPSVSAWGAPEYRTLNASTRSTTFTGLQNGRRYRAKVSLRNSSGSSAWSGYRTLTPAAKPRTPKAPRWLTATSSKIRYAWWKSATHGTPVTSYTVAIRRRAGSGFTPWVATTVAPSVLNHNWTAVRGGRTYQVRVRANSAVGSSGYTAPRAITVPH